jgi:ABC-type taurine transport system ATPase subunit
MCYSPSAEGSRIDGIAISSTSAAQKTVLLQLNDGVQVCKLGHIIVPAGAGTNGSVAVVSGLNRANLPWLKVDSNGNPYINLNSGMNLEAKLLSALAAGETMDFTIFGANYDA